jgi:F420-dependent oxidoreductase-like protein
MRGAQVKLGVIINYSTDFLEAVEEVRLFEANGLDVVAVPEAYAFDAPTQLGYLAAVTSTVTLVSSVMPIYSRTPALTAMTAAGADRLSGGRFQLGLGSSGPQVIEGLHGVDFNAPLGRTREIIEICRLLWRGEKSNYNGRHYQLPLDGGTGLGRPLALIQKPLRSEIPILLAAIGPKNVELAAEVADGWQPLFFHPERHEEIWGESLARGSEKRDGERGVLDIHVQVPLIGGGVDSPAFMAAKSHYALYIGGMGAPERNFYFQLATRYGYSREAKQIQQLFLSGAKTEAAQMVPDELVVEMSLIGPHSQMAAQLEKFEAAGVGTIYLLPFDTSAEERSAAVRSVLAAGRSRREAAAAGAKW